MRDQGYRHRVLGLALVCGSVLLNVEANAVLTTNFWSDSSGQWETGSNWQLGVPSLNSQSVLEIQGGGFIAKTIFVNATTVLSNAINQCMTISNLTIAGVTNPVTINTLSLPNAGSTTPLHILHSFVLTSNGNDPSFANLSVTNSVLRVDGLAGGVFSVDGVVTLNTGTITAMNNGSLETHIGDLHIGQMAVLDGTWLTDFAYVGFHSGSQGTLTMGGGTISLGNLYVGNNGTGAAWMTGGQLSVSEFLFLGNVGGQMAVSNGTASLHLLTVGAGSTLTIAGGTVSFDSANPTTGIIEVGSGGTAWLTGGQILSTTVQTLIGVGGNGQVIVSNGTWQARNVELGTNAFFSMTGPGEGTLTIAGGTSSVNINLTLGDFACASTGVVDVVGGELDVTNSLGSAVLEVRSGTFILSGGVLRADKIIVTNTCAHFVRTGGTLIYGSAVLNPTDDTDGDGIPNGYEQSHGLDPLNAADASADNDGDGQSNLQEYLAGTDPNSSTSSFQIASMVITGNDLRVAWTMGPGKTNALQRTTGDGSGGYSSNSFANIFIVTNTLGTLTNFLDVGAAANNPSRYYRVRVVP